MAFLDNSGDIILDAVLTDTGRKRMAEGNFRITKFALADDEIDYSLYNFNDGRGSAYYDLDILSSPILEAFTDNAAGLKSKLVSYTRNDLEYLPVMKLSNLQPSEKINSSTNSFLVSADSTTDNIFVTTPEGLFKKNTVGNTRIAIHQGIDNVQVPHTTELEPDLIEAAYIIEMDNRILRLRNPEQSNNTYKSLSYVDDDQMASYVLVSGEDSNYFEEIANYNSPTGLGASVIAGARNSNALILSLAPAEQLAANDYLFDALGDTFTFQSNDYKYIDVNVRIMGSTTGYRIDVPVRVIKLAN